MFEKVLLSYKMLYMGVLIVILLFSLINNQLNVFVNNFEKKMFALICRKTVQLGGGTVHNGVYLNTTRELKKYMRFLILSTL